MNFKEAKTMVTLIRKNYQVTLPAKVRQSLHLKVGDVIEVRAKEGRIILIPKRTIDPEQAYFWSKEWQEAEGQVEENLRHGKVHKAASVEQLLKDLKR